MASQAAAQQILPAAARAEEDEDQGMRLSVRGAGSLELPLRIFNLLTQHGAAVERAVVERDGDGYRLLLDLGPGTAARRETIVAKMRAMVLVADVERR